MQIKIWKALFVSFLLVTTVFMGGIIVGTFVIEDQKMQDTLIYNGRFIKNPDGGYIDLKNKQSINRNDIQERIINVKKIKANLESPVKFCYEEARK